MKTPPPPSYRPVWVWVTPSVAKELLQSSGGNRSISQNLVDGLVETIKRGDWKSTHQGIAFDTQGRLRDGHHRLMAIAKAGIAAFVLVTYNLPDDVCEAIDDGRRRTVVDNLRLRSVFNPDEESGQDAKHAHLRVGVYTALQVLERGRSDRQSMSVFNEQRARFGTVVNRFEGAFGSLRIELPSEGSRKMTATSAHVAALIYAWQPFPDQVGRVIEGIKTHDVVQPAVHAVINLMLMYRGHNGMIRPLMFKILRVLSIFVTGENISMARPHDTRVGYDFFRKAREHQQMVFHPWAEDPPDDSTKARRIVRLAGEILDRPFTLSPSLFASSDDDEDEADVAE